MLTIAQMLKFDEGLRQRVYKCSRGYNTVGIGFNMDDPSARTVWAEANIKESFNLVIKNQQSLSLKSVSDLLYKCIDNIKINAKWVFPEFDSYPEHVQLAVLNMLFQMGPRKLAQFTKTVSLIKEKKFAEASVEALDSSWAKQTPARAKRVTDLLKGDYSGYNHILEKA